MDDIDKTTFFNLHLDKFKLPYKEYAERIQEIAERELAAMKKSAKDMSRKLRNEAYETNDEAERRELLEAAKKFKNEHENRKLSAFCWPADVDELVFFGVQQGSFQVYVNFCGESIRVMRKPRDDYDDWRKGEPFFFHVECEHRLIMGHKDWCSANGVATEDFMSWPVLGLSLGCTDCNMRKFATIGEVKGSSSEGPKVFYMLQDGSYLSTAGYRDVSAYNRSGRMNVANDRWEFAKWKHLPNMKNTNKGSFMEKRVLEQDFPHAFVVKKYQHTMCIYNLPVVELLSHDMLITIRESYANA